MAANLGAGRGISGWDSGGGFSVPKVERRRFIESVLKWFGAGRHGRAGKGVFLGDIERMTPLVRPYRKSGSCRTGTSHTQPRLHPPFYRHGHGRAGRNGCPFAILGFHLDNGSEYINYQVAGPLETLWAEFTTLRPRHSNDTARRSPSVAQSCANIWALPKSRHTALAWSTISVRITSARTSTSTTNASSWRRSQIQGEGVQRGRYEEMKTLYEKLQSIPYASQYLKPASPLNN